MKEPNARISQKIKKFIYTPRYFYEKIRLKWMFMLHRRDQNLKGPLHPHDGMFDGSVEHYIRVGEDAIRLMEQSLKKANLGWNQMNAILDIPCGYGRELRILVTKVPANRITACDIMQEQIDFCSKEFGCKKFLSSNDLLSIQFPEKYSLIWVGSLFTHLDKDRFEDLLRLLFGALSQNGILVFTAHGKFSVDIFDSYWQKGFAPMTASEVAKKLSENGGFSFWPYKYDSTFGISISLKEYVTSLCEKLFKNKGKIISYEAKGWDQHQDVYAIQKVD